MFMQSRAGAAVSKSWYHFWAGRDRYGKHVRVLLGPMMIAPEDPRIFRERYPTRRDSVDGPEMDYLGSFTSKPLESDLDELDPEGAKRCPEASVTPTCRPR